MFKDRYHGDNDKIEPDKALLKYLSVKMKETAAKAPVPEKKRNHFRMRFAAALAVCFAFAITGISLYTNQNHMTGSYTADTIIDRTAQSNYASATSGSSYAELYALMISFGTKDQEFTAGAVENARAADTATSSANAGDYSKTNIQVDGVDEADRVKTDGRYIYALSGNTVFIADTDDGNLKITSRISCDNQKNGLRASEIYVCNNRLVVLQSQYTAVCGTGTVNEFSGSRMRTPAAEKTQAAIYDITDKSNPVLIGTPGQSGGYLTSRMVGDTLYLVSNYWVNSSSIEEDKPETYVPSLYNGESGTPLTSDTICVSTDPQESNYVVVSAINVQKPEILSSQSILGCGTQLYATEKNLYIASVHSVQTTSDKNNSSGSSPAVTAYSYKTDLIRLSLDNGQIAVKANGSVPGTLLNQYSMDEYNGTFRLVTTDSGYTQTTGENGSITASQNQSSNALYTLDQNLNILGSITDIAKGEQVYSVRFNGTVGYFVTFRQVDPLFAADLSDPANPKILSALKIPGLSDYLHPYADGLLFGLGRDADEKTGHVNGLKLSMFDVSDPSNVIEKNKLLLDDRYSAASYNYKAIVVSPERNLIAFPAESNYLIFSYSADNGFTEKAKLSPGSLEYTTRGLFIGTVFYVVSDSAITAYRMDTYSKIVSVGF